MVVTRLLIIGDFCESFYNIAYLDVLKFVKNRDSSSSYDSLRVDQLANCFDLSLLMFILLSVKCDLRMGALTLGSLYHIFSKRWTLKGASFDVRVDWEVIYPCREQSKSCGSKFRRWAVELHLHRRSFTRCLCLTLHLLIILTFNILYFFSFLSSLLCTSYTVCLF